jgi:lysylphosphatidylglycerol synthase-like protein
MRWISRLLFVAGVAVAIWMISQFPLSDIYSACADLGVGVLITPFVAVGWYAAACTAVYHLLERRMRWRALLWNRLIGEAYNMLIPAAGFGGEPFKLQQIRRYVDTNRAVVALVNDRLIENAIGLGYSAACIGVAAFHLDTVTPALRTTMLSYAGAAGAVSLVIAAIVFVRLPGRFGIRVARWLGAHELSEHQVDRANLARAVAWSVTARAIGLLETVVLFALLGVDLALWNVLFTNAALAAAGFVGGVIPQGIGVTEAAAVGVFELLQFPGPAGVAFALARRGRMLIVSSTFVALHAVLGRRLVGRTERSRSQ